MILNQFINSDKSPTMEHGIKKDLEKGRKVLPVDEAVKKCLKALKKATSDNERFAGLLLVTNLIKAEDLQAENRRTLYNAIGFKFISRLIKTSSEIQNCPPVIFKSIGMAVLSYFAPELVPRDAFVTLLPDVMKIVADLNYKRETLEVSERSLLDDCFKFLEIIASDKAGCEQISCASSFEALFEAVSLEEPLIVKDNRALNLIVQIHFISVLNLSMKYKSYLQNLMNALSLRFATTEEVETFDICKLLTLLMQQQLDENVWDENALQQGRSMKVNKMILDTRQGISKMLQSKIHFEQHQDALSLGAVLLEAFDVGLTGDDEQDINFIQLLLARASVEVNMALSDSSSLLVDPTECNILSVCFYIVEKTVTYLSNKDSLKLSGGGNEFHKTATMTQLHNVLLEVVKTVLTYVHCVAEHPETSVTDAVQSGIFCGAFRVICAWISEETAALQNDVVVLLPFIIRVLEESTKEVQCLESAVIANDQLQDWQRFRGATKSPGVNLIRFFLPGLCHMSAEETLSPLLFENDILGLLGAYFQQSVLALTVDSGDSSARITAAESLETLLGILLNFSIIVPADCMKNIFYRKFFAKCSQCIPLFETQDNGVSLLTNSITLYFIVLRWQSTGSMALQEFDSSILVKFLDLLETINGSDVAVHGDSLELWLIGIDNLVVSCEKNSKLRQQLKRDNWSSKVGCILLDVKKKDGNNPCLLPLASFVRVVDN